MATHFNPAALRFLRGLARHNERPWFNERKAIFERELKEPLLAVIDEINGALEEVAPEYVRPAAKCMMRIYRDTRFSNNKLPYKTQVAAWWAREGLEKTSGAGFYLSLSATEVTVAAGAYMPEREQLLAIRRHLAEEHATMRGLLAEPQLLAAMQPSLPSEDGAQPLRRAPKGFAPDSPALDLIVQRQWGVAATLGAEAALEKSFVDEVVRRFRLAVPLVSFLNVPLVPAKKAIF